MPVIPEHGEFYQHLGHRLTIGRHARGLSQRDVGEALGCAQTKIHYIETGQLRVSVYDLINLCILYRLNVNVELEAAWRFERERV